jgi:hypothetical protein
MPRPRSASPHQETLLSSTSGKTERFPINPGDPTLSENAKTRLDLSNASMEQSGSETSHSNTPPPMDDAEAQMRRALGLNGTLRPRQDAERSDPQPRIQDRFNPAHRRRFVQDGDVPVAYVRRDAPQPELTARQPVPAAPANARLQRLEAQLATETAARQQAERGFNEAQSALRDLRTKLGYADLARNEAVEALRRERESQQARMAALQEQIAQLPELEAQVKSLTREVAALQSQLQDEKAERKAVEKALRAADDARETAERLVRVLSEGEAEGAGVTTLASRRTAKAAAKPVARVVEDEQQPEPVKWWLSGPTAKRR